MYSTAICMSRPSCVQVILRQYDYGLLVESFLYFSWPQIGALVKRYVLPANGAALAYLGQKIHQHGSRKVCRHAYLPWASCPAYCIVGVRCFGMSSFLWVGIWVLVCRRTRHIRRWTSLSAPCPA